jgi:hypothetical protein
MIASAFECMVCMYVCMHLLLSLNSSLVARSPSLIQNYVIVAPVAEESFDSLTVFELGPCLL